MHSGYTMVDELRRAQTGAPRPTCGSHGPAACGQMGAPDPRSRLALRLVPAPDQGHHGCAQVMCHIVECAPHAVYKYLDLLYHGVKEKHQLVQFITGLGARCPNVHLSGAYGMDRIPDVTDRLKCSSRKKGPSNKAT